LKNLQIFVCFAVIANFVEQQHLVAFDGLSFSQGVAPAGALDRRQGRHWRLL
jgi:hypothetical protein